MIVMITIGLEVQELLFRNSCNGGEAHNVMGNATGQRIRNGNADGHFVSVI